MSAVHSPPLSPDTASLFSAVIYPPHPAALARRLRRAASVLLPSRPVTPAPDSDDPWLDASILLDELITSIRADLSADRLWLLFTAISTVFPTTDELLATIRRIRLSSSNDEAAIALLDAALDPAIDSGWAELDIEIVTGAVLVDVDFTATSRLHTGIQRVVRSALPHWQGAVELVGWTPNSGTLRHLRASEQARVLAWGTPAEEIDDEAQAELRLVVPWQSVLVLAEVPPRSVSERLAALANFSGNAVSAIGYDCIPVVSADLVPAIETEKFVRYLGILKHARMVAAISVSAAAEFTGFARMMATQGLPGPDVAECRLPAPAFEPGTAGAAEPGPPTILCVGSFEPRKNQLALLYAAEVLWREGLSFQLRFVGGSAWGREFPKVVRMLRKRHRDIQVQSNIDEWQLQQAYATARFSVFTSVHEGYGLPVVESLAAGTPVVTSNFGSLSEIAADGGTLLVNPRDDDQLVVAMRDLLVDDELIAKLTAEIATRPARSWADYASELWATAVAPYLVRRP